jgi:uncharacterized protein (UPF0276 family)
LSTTYVVNAKAEKAVTPLGIGFPYFASLPAEMYQAGLLDFVEVTPEGLCRQRSNGKAIAIDIVPEQVERARKTCGSLPMVVHGVELSIGSVQGWNEAYVEMLDSFQARWPFVWHSEHLGFQTIPGQDGMSLEVGVPLPLPPTEEAVGLVSERSRTIRERYGVPFLLENPAHYLAGLPADPGIADEGGLMDAITERSGCFQLLDLHNVYCNSVNHQCDALSIIDRMPLDRVVEIHVAGGSSHDGFWMDAHDGRVPEPVWDLLEYTLPRAPNVAGIVFEMLDEHAVVLGPKAIAEELTRARTIWRRWRNR